MYSVVKNNITQQYIDLLHLNQFQLYLRIKTNYSVVVKPRNFINNENLIMTTLCCSREEHPAPLFVVCAEIKFWSTDTRISNPI